MRHHNVSHGGHYGVGYNTFTDDHLVIVQVGEVLGDQARIVLTVPEAEAMIDRLREKIEHLRSLPPRRREPPPDPEPDWTIEGF